MARLIDIKNSSDELHLKNRQLPIPIYLGFDDEKVMIMQLNPTCDYCKEMTNDYDRSSARKPKLLSEDSSDYRNLANQKPWSEEQFLKLCNKLSREEAIGATLISSKTLFNKLAQVVGCVGCRRSVERLFNQLKDSECLVMDPVLITKGGFLTVDTSYPLHLKNLNTLFSQHKTPLSEMVGNITKNKKSGRCILHCMDNVRCRLGSHSWMEMWKEMKLPCKKVITTVDIDQLLVTLNEYLRRHRFCHECKSKVHRAYNILTGNIAIDDNKEKGYVSSLYSGITSSKGKHLILCYDTEYIMGLITRAEPELQGRDTLFLSRERHAKTMEIAQEEVLTCLGLFMYERLQRIYSRMKEEEQSFDILFHIGLDLIRRNFELAVEEKEGFSKLEKLCEELQQQELMEKAKKEKRSRKKKNKKKNVDTKENNYICEETSCEEAQVLGKRNTRSPEKHHMVDKSLAAAKVISTSAEELSDSNWNLITVSSSKREVRRKALGSRTLRACSEDKVLTMFPEHEITQPLESSLSVDSLTLRCPQCCKDGGYCSGRCSNHLSNMAYGDGCCPHSNGQAKGGATFTTLSPGVIRLSTSYTPSLTEMLDDSSCGADEIPEAEVLAWNAQIEILKEKREELRQTLRQRFQNLCHQKSLGAVGEASSSNLVLS